MRNVLLFSLAVLVLTCTATAQAEIWTDNFESYTVGSNLSGQGGWTDSSGANNAYQVLAGGAGGTQGIGPGGGSTQINWTGHGWDWGNLLVGDKVIARMDFQANGSGAFDDDRVGWITQTGSQQAVGSQSAYHFAVQLDNPDGGLQTYFRNNTGGRVFQTTLISNATLGATLSNWYREELQVTKLTSGLGLGGAQVDVSFTPLDGISGNPTGSPLTASYGTIDTSALRGFSGTVYPMFKNYSGTGGNADNAYFEIRAVPEPSTIAMLIGAGLALVVGYVRRRK